MLKAIFLTILLTFSARSYGAFGIAEDHPALKFCDAVATVGMILSQYPMPHLWPSIQVLPFPPFIAPGILAGAASRTAIIVELCDLLYNIQKGDTQSAIFATAGVLNNQTENRWDDHLQMADQTWKVANSLYDFEAGKQRKGALQSAMVHRELNDYMRTSYGWFNKTFNGRDAQLKTRGERESDMKQFASIVNQKAILAETQACPNASANPNYSKIYDLEIRPLEIKKEFANDDLIFIREKLSLMGPRFVNDQKELEDYLKGLEDIQAQGISYEVKNSPKREKTMKPHPSRKDKQGKPIMVATDVKTMYQQWSYKIYTDLINSFTNKWSPKWQSWVTAQYVQSSQGLLTNGRDKIEDEFRDLTFECSPARLMRGFPDTRSDYIKIQDERVDRCQKEVKMNQKRAENIFLYYMQQLQIALTNVKDAQAQMWTKESFHLGTFRSVNPNDASSGFKQEQVACAESNNLTMAEMEMIQRKQEAINNETKQMIAKQYLKKTNMMESERHKKSENEEELRKKQQFAEEKQKQNSNAMKNKMDPLPVSGGI